MLSSTAVIHILLSAGKMQKWGSFATPEEPKKELPVEKSAWSGIYRHGEVPPRMQQQQQARAAREGCRPKSGQQGQQHVVQKAGKEKDWI